MILKAPPYQPPPPAFKPGEQVKYEGKIYTVTASSHAHVGLEGLRYAVAAFLCTRVKRSRK